MIQLSILFSFKDNPFAILTFCAKHCSNILYLQYNTKVKESFLEFVIGIPVKIQQQILLFQLKFRFNCELCEKIVPFKMLQ